MSLQQKNEENGASKSISYLDSSKLHKNLKPDHFLLQFLHEWCLIKVTRQKISTLIRVTSLESRHFRCG